MKKPILILFVGLPGTGKTTAGRIAEKEVKRSIFFDSDAFAIKEKLFEQFKKSKKSEYAKIRAKFYDKKVSAAKKLLKQGKIVIVDAVFDKENLRKKFYRAVEETKARLILIEIKAPSHVSRKRILKDASKGRKKARKSGRWDMYKKMKKTWQPLEREHHTINSEKKMKFQILKILKKEGLK